MSRSHSVPSGPNTARNRSRHHACARTSVAAALLVVTGALSVTIGAAAATASVAGDHGLASRINMNRTDLPAGTQWTSSPSTPNPSGWVTISRKVLACIQHAAGHALVVSPDPFGLGAGPAGDVTADVSSPTFAVKGPSQLPSASSEVVMTTAAAQATSDLPRRRHCVGAPLLEGRVPGDLHRRARTGRDQAHPPAAHASAYRAVATTRRLAHRGLRSFIRRS